MNILSQTHCYSFIVIHWYILPALQCKCFKKHTLKVITMQNVTRIWRMSVIIQVWKFIPQSKHLVFRFVSDFKGRIDGQELLCKIKWTPRFGIWQHQQRWICGSGINYVILSNKECMCTSVISSLKVSLKVSDV